MTSIHIVLIIMATKGFYLEELDVKTTFVHGGLDGVMYMEQPLELKVKGMDNLVCRLKKKLYGLNQEPR